MSILVSKFPREADIRHTKNFQLNQPAFSPEEQMLSRYKCVWLSTLEGVSCHDGGVSSVELKLIWYCAILISISWEVGY